jgi:hypothetical protein
MSVSAKPSSASCVVRSNDRGVNRAVASASDARPVSKRPTPRGDSTRYARTTNRLRILTPGYVLISCPGRVK